AFGRIIGQVGSTVNLYLFAGEQRDANVGLDYLRARWMSPLTGRLISADIIDGLIESPATLNRYGYALSSPTQLVDPAGTQALYIQQVVALAALSYLSAQVAIRFLPALQQAACARVEYEAWSQFMHGVFNLSSDLRDAALGTLPIMREAIQTE